MYVFDELRDMLEKELKSICKQDSMTPQNLEGAYKAVDILKDIETIEAMRNSGYSYDDGMSYARGRDSMGRYTSRDGGYSGYSYADRNYSRHDEKEQMLKKLYMMSDTATDPQARHAIDQCIAQLES